MMRVGRDCVRWVVLAAVLALGGCGGPPKPQPKPLSVVQPQLPDRQVWSARVGPLSPAMKAAVLPDAVIVASTRGDVKAFSPLTGDRLWQTDAKVDLSAGVGSDGRYVAVISVDNELLVFDRERQIWKVPLSTRVVTAPLVAGERVFVLGVDRSVNAFDVLDGRRLWTVQRPGDPLTLAQPGVLLPDRNQLMAGVGAKLVVLDPLTGGIRQEWTLANPRGANEVERLADLVGPAVKTSDLLCAHAYQAAVGCVNVGSGQLVWTQTVGGYFGLASHGNGNVVGADATDRISAWRAADGQVAWTNDALMYYGLGAPGSTDTAIVFGDKTGRLHFLSPQDGKFLLRLSTDGSPIVAAPQRSGKTLVVTTQDGGVFAFRAD